MDIENNPLLNQKLAKLKWQCRRGMLELDLVLNAFIQKKLPVLKEAQLKDFETLLSLSDPALYAVLIEQSPPPEELKDIVQLVRF